MRTGSTRVGTPPRPIAVVLAAVTLVACGDGAEPGGGGAPADTARPDGTPHAVVDSGAAAVEDTIGPGQYAFVCADGHVFGAEVADDSVTLELGAREVSLPRVPAASGTRYERGDTLFWSRGPEALLRAEELHEGCQGERAADSWEKARLLGIEYRGLGQEPGWILDIHPDRWIRYIGDYGETRFLMPPAEPARDGATLRYHTETAEHTLTAVIREEPCRDAMSGHPFDYTVHITVDGRQLRGCARRLSGP